MRGETERDLRDLMSGFSLDEPAVADALEARQRPKPETYRGICSSCTRI